ncbi:NosD domain-containing protein [Candidatus Bipolaricaulota bacterium]
MRRKSFLLVAAVALLLASVTLASGQPDGGIGCWVDRETIYIYGDGDFTFENGVVAGCGSPESPYIIEGWRIVAQRADFGINIEHTTRYFLIRNCIVIGGSGAAIRLNTLSNGVVEGCQLLRSERGILLENASRNAVSGNYISENRRGALPTLGSWGNIFTANIFVANGRSAEDPYAENHWHWSGVGNYWSDYAGEDCNGDGIGDTPYELVDDPFPLMTQAGCAITPLSIPAGACGVSGHSAGCGIAVGTPCYTIPAVVISPPAPCGPSAACTHVPTCPSVAQTPCGPQVVCTHVPACATASVCQPAAACLPAGVCNPCVTPCEDQILNCVRSAVTLTADVVPGNPSCAPCSIRWTNDHGEIVGTERNIAVREPGIYTISITGADGCSVSDSVAVFQDIDPPVVRATVDGVLTCGVTEVGLTAHISGGRPPYEIAWASPGGAAIGCESLAKATVRGRYTVTVTGANGCVSSAAVDVLQDIEKPVVRATVDETLTCETTAVTLTAEVTSGKPPYSYAWTKPGVDLVGSTPTVVVSEAGTYTVTVTGANGCSGSSTVTATEDANPPSVSASVNGVLTCNVTEVSLSAAISGGRPPYEVTWTMPGRGVVGEAASIRTAEPGTYTVTATGANGCWASAEVKVEQDIAPPTVDAGEDQMLTLEVREATFTANVAGCDGPCTVTWKDMFGEVVATTESITVSRPGLYYATATSTATGCSATDEVALDSDKVSEVMLESSIEGLAVFGQLLKDGVPIPGTEFHFLAGEDAPVSDEAEVSSMRLTDTTGMGVEANGAEVNYIIPTNCVVRFTIHKDQFILGKKYYLLHLPTDPSGEAAIAFF